MRRVLCVSILVVTLAGITSPAQAEDDTTKPKVTLTSPSTPFQLEPIAATWTGTDGDGSGIDGYQVRHKKAQGDQAFGEIITTGLAGDQTSFEVESLPGVTYCFSVAARDLAGNISAFTPWRCTSLPVDDALFEDVDFAWDEVADDDT